MLRLLFKNFLLASLWINFLLPVVVQAFPLNHIYVEGLRGISRDTVLSYLPIKVGQSFESSQSSSVINALYATGFFSNVSLEERGNALIIKVVERATISQVDISGNKEIPKDKLKKIVKKIGLVRGRLFDKATLDRNFVPNMTIWENIQRT